MTDQSAVGAGGRVAKGRLFDVVADDYDDVRPDYPPAVYDAIDAVTPLRGARVLDLAAGTGLATRALAARGADVVAVDAGVGMLARLHRRSPNVPALAATAEQLPFRPASFDLACCATAWHWIAADTAVAELGRVLRPAGTLALWWANHRRDDTLAWEAAQGAVQDRWLLRTGSRPPGQAGVAPREAAADLRARGLDVVVDTELTWSRVVPTAVHLRVIGTHSDVLALGPRRADFLAEVAAALRPWPEVEERLWGSLVVAHVRSEAAGIR